MWKRKQKRWEADFFRGSGSGREAFESSLPFRFGFPSTSTKLETPVKCMFIFYPLNHSFFIGQCGPGRGDPSLKKIFFLDFDIFMGINLTVFVHWFQICIKFYCGRSLSRDIGKKNLSKMCLKYYLGSGSGREAEDLRWKRKRKGSEKPSLPHHC